MRGLQEVAERPGQDKTKEEIPRNDAIGRSEAERRRMKLSYVS